MKRKHKSEPVTRETTFEHVAEAILPIIGAILYVALFYIISNPK